MVIELNWKFPFFHQVRPVVPQTKAPPPAPQTEHRTWVMVGGQKGYLHHHEASGWWVLLDSGEFVQTNNFVHIE